MSLALVIPVRDDGAALNLLVSGAQDLGIFDQIVVVDDGSLEPVAIDGAEVIRQEVSTGPGPARNRGLAEVGTEYVLFFDSDDVITSEIVLLWRELRQLRFDFCLFRHADSRQIARGNWRQMPLDDAFWRLAGMGGRHLCSVSADAAPWLAQTANYPWNKIYRTQFLRDSDIRFPDVPLHEDVAPHWKSFAKAEIILASDRVCAIHSVSLAGSRMTNIRGRERLDAIASLQEVCDELRPPLRLAFQHFISGLFDWIYYNIEPKWQRDMSAAMGSFWQATLSPEDEAQLIREDPVLALRIALQLAGGRHRC